jgi:DNA-binding response OmpR family regulator
VLVVDDNVDAAETLRALLELSGHTVKTAHGGQEALETLDEYRPDIVLLDIGLPDLDGYEVARRFRSHFGAACPLLIGLSGWGQDEHRKRATEAGIDAYYTKPINPAALTRLLEGRAGRNTGRANR